MTGVKLSEQLKAVRPVIDSMLDLPFSIKNQDSKHFDFVSKSDIKPVRNRVKLQAINLLFLHALSGSICYVSD